MYITMPLIVTYCIVGLCFVYDVIKITLVGVQYSMRSQIPFNSNVGQYIDSIRVFLSVLLIHTRHVYMYKCVSECLFAIL